MCARLGYDFFVLILLLAECVLGHALCSTGYDFFALAMELLKWVPGDEFLVLAMELYRCVLGKCMLFWP